VAEASSNRRREHRLLRRGSALDSAAAERRSSTPAEFGQLSTLAMLSLQFIHIYVELLFGCNNFKENASEHNLPQGARFSPVRTPPPARGFFLWLCLRSLAPWLGSADFNAGVATMGSTADVQSIVLPIRSNL
jgi:hypothetical protein